MYKHLHFSLSLLAAVSTAGHFGHCLVVHHKHQGTEGYVQHIDQDHSSPGPHHGLLGFIKWYLSQAGGRGGEEGPGGLTGSALPVTDTKICQTIQFYIFYFDKSEASN